MGRERRAVLKVLSPHQDLECHAKLLKSSGLETEDRGGFTKTVKQVIWDKVKCEFT